MNELKAFFDRTIEIFHYYAQTKAGIRYWHNHWIELSNSKRLSPNEIITVGKGDPNNPNTNYQYYVGLGQFLIATAPNGRHEIMLNQSIIVLIVASWEVTYRNRIASEIGIEKNELESDLFHDLNKYRQAILHVDERLDVEPRVLKHFALEDRVEITDTIIEDIFEKVVDELNRIGFAHYQVDPQFRLNKELDQTDRHWTELG